MIRIQCSQCGTKLKAPDDAAGKTTNCPKCGTKITIQEPVYDAEALPDSGGPPPSDAYDLATDPYGLSESPSGLPPKKGGGGDEGTEARRPCPMCGEMILATAAKCRFCGEVFDEGLKKVEKKKKRKKKGYSDEDSDLSTSEWIICILCSGIGCIAGVVYMIQGKPKGIKMVGISILVGVIWNVIAVAMRSVQQP
ncbi:MAG TPA: hypothetical protein VGZ22_15515 [Isosphaeraceae bacterium]|jgi:predicted RNA-binding Zn-ribbon protein involved in translation (DUF1610 family)|nr:hypothetical protein [Isosphaeraceae bacterium]